ncbi:hypothetical protein CDAR_403621 [Caerostris darwini]|uniref:Uncharacterized protein n=1 Tax=Caerostris darwini TaxID=1538125 RepID=A0AAV4PW76_9ARAC|nr:hypothetical protein CDAR_403621 [Caerostris darwini]
MAEKARMRKSTELSKLLSDNKQSEARVPREVGSKAGRMQSHQRGKVKKVRMRKSTELSKLLSDNKQNEARVLREVGSVFIFSRKNNCKISSGRRQ